MRNLLQTKRKSATPSFSIKQGSQSASSVASSSTSGLGKGKHISSRGKHINSENKVKKPPKAGKQSIGIIKEIRRLQKGFDLLLPRASFHRIVRDITMAVTNERNDAASDRPGFRYQAAALEALQEATETFMVRLFEDAYLCTHHAKRVTLFIQDLRLCQRLQNIPSFQAV